MTEPVSMSPLQDTTNSHTHGQTTLGSGETVNDTLNLVHLVDETRRQRSGHSTSISVTNTVSPEYSYFTQVSTFYESYPGPCVIHELFVLDNPSVPLTSCTPCTLGGRSPTIPYRSRVSPHNTGVHLRTPWSRIGTFLSPTPVPSHFRPSKTVLRP